MSAPLWVMTDDVCWRCEDDSIDEIEHAMARHQIRRLPDGRKRGWRPAARLTSIARAVHASAPRAL
jgi:CBS-domain-containing membrane protein